MCPDTNILKEQKSKCLTSPSIVNYRKTKTIFSSTLNSHVNWDTLYKVVQIFLLFMYPPILKRQGAKGQTTFSKAHKTLSLYLDNPLSFINYRKSKMIFKSSFNSHVYWNTLYIS